MGSIAVVQRKISDFLFEYPNIAPLLFDCEVGHEQRTVPAMKSKRVKRLLHVRKCLEKDLLTILRVRQHVDFMVVAKAAKIDPTSSFRIALTV